MIETGLVGPYRIVDLLGRGGVGAVYRAVHRETGRQVALKTLEAPVAAFLPTLRREIAALARLRHPQIVRILDSGSHHGLPWLAMELVEGQDLRQHCQGRPLLETLNCVRGLCDALAYLHGEGLVHRDLKPDNVLVLPSRESPEPGFPTPVIIDFGVAARFGGELSREVLEVEAGGSGTLSYMAPEQLRGELVDARADLYALGCILYELLTGLAPFCGRKARALAQAHLHEAPQPPSSLVPQLPEALDELVLRLLAKSPRDRLGHAEDVVATLGRLGAAQGSAQPGTGGGVEVSAALPRPRTYLYRPGLAGREEPLGRLEATLDRLQEGVGGLLLVGGESGVGKSRMALELGRRAERRGVQVLAGDCLPAGASDQTSAWSGAGPLQPLRKPLQKIADRCRSRGPEETGLLLGRRGKLLALYEPALLGLPGLEAHPEPVELPAAAARLRLFGFLNETLEALAQEAPTLLLLDDLHWADDLTLGWLEQLLQAGRLGSQPLLIVATYRSEERSIALERLLEHRGSERLDLGRLEQETVGQLVSDMLGLPAAPEGLVRSISRHSEGNPFFVAEYLRTAVAEGLLWRDGQGRWQAGGPQAADPTSDSRRAAPDYEALPLPRSLRDTVERRLGTLSFQSQGLVEAASVLGREMEEPLLLATAQVDETAALEALEELRVREVLEGTPAGGLRFGHDKLREVAYERQPVLRRRELHGRAAQALEAGGPSELQTDPAALAWHWDGAGASERARPYHLAAARKAAARYSHAEAEAHYGAYLAGDQAPTAESVAARNDLASNVLWVGGKSRQAQAEQLHALEEARLLQDSEAEGAAQFGMARILLSLGSLDEARDWGSQALATARTAGRRSAEAQALGLLGSIAEARDDLPEARALHQQSAELFRQLGRSTDEMYARTMLAGALRRLGRDEEARLLYEQAVAHFRAAGHRRYETTCLVNLIALHCHRGNQTAALELGERSLALLREIGDRRVEAYARCLLAIVHHALGRFEQALGLLHQALGAFREIADRANEAFALSLLADNCLDRGRPHEARETYQLVLSSYRELGRALAEAETLVQLAGLERRLGEPSGRVRDFLRQAEKIVRAGDSPLVALVWLCESAHVELAEGKTARAAIDEASQLLQQLGFGPESPFSSKLRRLQDTQEAFEAGRSLFRGECVEDLPDALRRWLAETGQLGEH